MKVPTFVAYVDESGCDGDKFGTGSSDFLALSAIVGFDIYEYDIDLQINLARSAILKGDPRKKPEWTIPKFEKANPTVQWMMCERFAELMFVSTHVLIHKPSITDLTLRRDRNRLYRYGSKFLLERISWICERLYSPQAGGDGSCRIIFSQDLSRSYSAFREYVAILARAEKKHHSSIRWEHVDHSLIVDRPFKNDAGLLMADYHASAVGLAIERKSMGQFDDRFARILGERVFKDPERKSAFSYGFKFWPKEAERLYHTQQFSWMKRV